MAIKQGIVEAYAARPAQHIPAMTLQLQDKGDITCSWMSLSPYLGLRAGGLGSAFRQAVCHLSDPASNYTSLVAMPIEIDCATIIV